MTSLLKIGHNTVLTSGQYVNTSQLLLLGKERWADGSTAAESAFYAEPTKKCQFESSQVFTHLGLTFNTRDMTIDKMSTIEAQAAMVVTSPICRSDEIGRTDECCQYGSIPGKITLTPATILAQRIIRSPANLLKSLKHNYKVRIALPWWLLFVLKMKSMPHPLVKEMVRADASMKGFGGHMNDLFFSEKEGQVDPY